MPKFWALDFLDDRIGVNGMNYIFLSPHFPPNYYQFCVHLNKYGANVLGIADEKFEDLRPELRDSLTEYYRVKDMHSYDQLLRAVGFYTHRYGKINGIDSQNEYWLETEARLRTDFNIPGLKINNMDAIKRKSMMKQKYIQAGIEVARGQMVNQLEDAKSFIAEVGYPVVAKPDIGVGAAQTYRINNLKELKYFFDEKPSMDYFMEEFIQGQITSFDGLVDFDGNLVFSTAHLYSSGVMEAVNQDQDIYYHSYREIPLDLQSVGLKTLKGFNVRGRFFHFEYFRTNDNRLVALEVNMRPPGGLTTDMFNYANDIDVYEGWAELMVRGSASFQTHRPYFVAYVGRKNSKVYRYDHHSVLNACGENLCYHEPIQGVFSPALGNYGYLIRSPELDEIMQLVEYIQKVS
jgi:hypothetical protein